MLKSVPRVKTETHLEDVFDDPLLVMVTGFQVLHVELEQVQGGGA